MTSCTTSQFGSGGLASATNFELFRFLPITSPARSMPGAGQPSARTLCCSQNAPPLRDQLMWLAVLDAGEDAALGSHTSLELGGFTRFARKLRRSI